MFTVQSRSFCRRALRSAVHDPAYVTQEVEDGYMRPFRLKGNTRSMAALIAQRRTDGPVDVRRITQPTLVLWGEQDRWFEPNAGRELAAQIPGAGFDLIRSAGHLPLEEQPELSARRIVPFLLAKPVPQAAGAQTGGG
jgi:pimeloyl-ACP methyl ester carboxylesterase